MMKILELRFKNLNSLYGEWVVDFSDPHYISDGIFALTGPTGSGKTTILDAICLALYGQTPRLNKITKSGNEAMSRGAGGCYAEVLFESQAVRFRCHWEQNRARQKSDGNLQEQEHWISNADTKELIESKKSLVVPIVEAKTGMDFDRFTRSILLAQGSFDTFLKAKVDEKSKVLEQITGTEIYTKISLATHKREKLEKDKLALLTAETAGFVILNAEQEAEIQQELELKQTQTIASEAQLKELTTSIAWLNNIAGLKKDIQNLTGEAAELKNATEAFKPKQEKLKQAIKAAELDGRYATLLGQRKQESDDQVALKVKEAELPKLEASAKTQAETHKLNEEQVLSAKEALKTSAPLIQKVRSLDQQLFEQAKSISEADKVCSRAAAELANHKQTLVKEQEKRASQHLKMQTIEAYLKEHARDEWLIAELAGVEAQFSYLLEKQSEVVQKVAAHKSANKNFEKAVKDYEITKKQAAIRKQEVAEVRENIEAAKNALTELLGDKTIQTYRDDKEKYLRAMAEIKTIKSFEPYRLKLEDGKPCSLCGSKEHPYAKGNVPLADAIELEIDALTELISKAEKLEDQYKKQQAKEIVVNNSLYESERLEAAAANEKKAAEKVLNDLSDALKTLQTALDALRQALSDKLKPLDIVEIPQADASSLLDALKSRLKKWQTYVAQKTEIEKQIEAIDSEIKRLNAVIDNQNENLIERKTALESLRAAHANASDERKALYGDKKPDEEERRLQKAIETAEETEKKSRALSSELQQQLTAVKTHIGSLQESIARREPELKQLETAFLEALISAGFANEMLFKDARLTQPEREALSLQAKKLENAAMELVTKQRDREMRLTTELAKNVTDKEIEALNAELKTCEDVLKELRDIIAGHKLKLSENLAAKERLSKKQVEIDAQNKELQRWQKLNALIGSSEGKTYRNFAQGLTFDLMLTYANRQLSKMRSRYELVRGNKESLDLDVIDNDQAGEIRSTANLSGGESFMVSLTLALGLSQMASRKVRVDSLFLDEGFGTLDEEALQSALDVLSEFQQDGKLIGIVSHVAALKEKIPVQILIEPGLGGRSTLSGPGCRKLENGK